MRGRSSSRELSVYDGRDCLGRIEVDTDGAARAFGRWGKNLGTFPNAADAQRAFDVPNDERIKQRRKRHAKARGKSVARRS
jgi:hypothetical protein